MIFEHKHSDLFVGPACPFMYPAHVHEGVEIVYVESGTQHITANGTSYLLVPGDILLVFPMVIHSYEGASEEDGSMCIGMNPDLINEFRTCFKTTLPRTPFYHVSENDTELRQIIRTLRNIPSDYPPQVTAYVHLFLALLMPHMQLDPLEAYVDSNLIHRILLYISDHIQEPLTLDSVSLAMGISRSHLSHIFSQRLHMNFRKFINSMRIEYACTLLQNPAYSIKEVTYACGYDNSRTFHRSFLAEVGMTPGDYKKRKHDGYHLNRRPA